ncbi:MAG: metallophosphoesterase [Ruminococcus flavefaciens]|nr:metallophosphoesterase [Ruminococcus flavefaciens]
MKKTIKRAVLSIISVIIIAALCFGGYLLYRFNCDKSGADIEYSAIYASDSTELDVDENGLFRVMKINDTHFFNGTCENDVKTLECLEKVLNENPCDLIIVNGDLIEGFNLDLSYDKYKAVELFADLIESYDIPWTFAPGNNDGEIDGENEDVIRYLMKYDNFICGNKEGIDGTMQLFIDLKSGGKTVHSIAVLDSHSRKIKAIGSYDYIKQSQIDWLADGINQRSVSTSVFFHMPTTDFKEAYYNGEAYNNFLMSDNNDYAEIKENELFADAFRDNEYITLLSCAHQHGNNMCTFYNNRYYQLSSVSGYSAGRPDYLIPSCTLTTIDVNADNAKAMYDFEQIFYE